MSLLKSSSFKVSVSPNSLLSKETSSEDFTVYFLVLVILESGNKHDTESKLSAHYI
jgi:hypothetical protein